MASQVFIFRFKLEWPIINCIERCVVFAMKCETDKAVLLNIFATNIEFDHAVGKIDAIDPGHAFSFVFTQANPGIAGLIEKSDLAVEGLYFFVPDLFMNVDDDRLLVRSFRKCWCDHYYRQEHND